MPVLVWGVISQACDIHLMGYDDFAHASLNINQEFHEHSLFALVEVAQFCDMPIQNDPDITGITRVINGDHPKERVLPDQCSSMVVTKAARRGL